MKQKGQSVAQSLQQNWINKLTDQGFRITKPLEIVSGILASSEKILNPTEVYQRARQFYPKIGLVTVYRTLEKLEQVGLIGRVHMPDGCQSFFQAQCGHQHLIICVKCSKAEYFEGDNLNVFFHSIGTQFGYQVQDHWLQLFGLCKQCQAMTLNPAKE
ncbi:MAG: hypothetical protein BGO78_04420 [Chloroflexi bacterium 44-23]|nr:MAG: hypothetical protein BGO78_04420 [Chloroflexi bacterium 44-23]